jgi:hypothetical protein
MCQQIVTKLSDNKHNILFEENRDIKPVSDLILQCRMNDTSGKIINTWTIIKSSLYFW